MNLKLMAGFAAALVLAGCCSCNDNSCACTAKKCPVSYPVGDGKCSTEDPVVGNWGLKLPYDFMNAGHMIVSRTATGKAEALVLWRWASPTKAKRCSIVGHCVTIDRGDFILKGVVDGDTFTGKVYSKGKCEGDVTGWRNPPVEPANTADAKFGEPIDLLKDGLNGWELMNKNAKNGWSFKDGVLSNKLGLKADGSWAGGGSNLMSKRADFYDFNLEYDVRVPTKSNSGVYLRGRYECQVLDSYGQKVDCHNMAAYYGRVTPSVAAEKKAGEWQHVSVTLYKRHLTVVLNGTKIIDNAPVVGITGGAIDADEFTPGPIYLQGDHSDADFRNMILRPVVD